MKKVVFFLSLIAITVLFASGQTRIFRLDETKATDLGKMLDNNNIIIGFSMDVDRDADDIYVLDVNFNHILRINLLSGNLIKIISSHGQGPAELNIPMAIRVHNDNVYVADKGFGGVKIFDKNDGHLVKAIKISTASMNDIDVSDHGDLILECANVKSNSFICEFDENGNNIRTRASADLSSDDAKEYYINTFIKYRLDKDGSLYVLFPLKRILIKYDAFGNQVWQRKVDNEVLKKATKEDDSIKFVNGTIRVTINIFNLSIDNSGNILIGHNGGGQLFSKDGRTITIFSNANIANFSFWNNNIVSFTPRGNAHIYNINSIREGER